MGTPWMSCSGSTIPHFWIMCVMWRAQCGVRLHQRAALTSLHGSSSTMVCTKGECMPSYPARSTRYLGNNLCDVESTGHKSIGHHSRPLFEWIVIDPVIDPVPGQINVRAVSGIIKPRLVS